MKKELMMVSVLLLVATISAVVLGLVNVTTKPIIERNEAEVLRKAVLQSMEIASEPGGIEEAFKDEVETKEINGRTVYLRYDDEGGLENVAFAVSGSGFQGQIQALIALKPDMKTIEGIEILNQQETPGLGARITEEDFLQQFKGKVIDPEILIVQGGSSGNSEVDAITGATRTSKAVQNIVNRNVDNVRSHLLTEDRMEELTHE
ncbi:MAG: RnfABCDGE type electron transport complex subunit G [Candidatus Bipolaricaulota bacterium]